MLNRTTYILSAVFLILAPFVGADSVGTCHPYPGAVAQDCLELIGNNLGSEHETTCGSDGRALLKLRNCSITTKCGAGVTAVSDDTAVRRALTAIGACALNDYGSISGFYTADDGSKTCYLYPGK